jgi:hypothetical protein
MFETMLREMLLKMVREDPDFRAEIMKISGEMYDNSVKQAVKYVIENDEAMQDVIRKQATTDIGELITDMIERDDVVKESFTARIVHAVNNDEQVIDAITERIDRAINDLTFEVSVS